jgi:hypothetical protein
MAPNAASAMCRSIRKPWSPASCSRTSGTPSAALRPEQVRRVVVTNLCVPTASGMPLDCCRTINGVRIIGIDVPGFGVPTHAEAKDVLSGAMLKRAREEAEAGPVARPRAGDTGNAPREPARRAVPGRSGRHQRDAAAAWGCAVGPKFPTREWRDLYAALDSAPSPAPCTPSTPPPCANSSAPAARSSVPARSVSTALPPGSTRSVKRRTSPKRRSMRPRRRNRRNPRSAAGKPDKRDDYGFRLRRFRASGRAPAHRVGCARAVCRHRLPEIGMERSDREWLEAHGACPVPGIP